MGYVAVADFRAATLQWWTRDLALDVVDVPDAQLTGAIQAQSDRIDMYCFDRFEPETSAFLVDGWGGTKLWVPKRIRTVTQVETQNELGVFTVETAGTYRVTGSLATGSRSKEDLDYIAVIPDRYLSDGKEEWPVGSQVVRLTGTFSWAATPEEIKRAVSLMVWDILTRTNPDLRRASQLELDGEQLDLSASKPTGIPEADEIIGRFTRIRNQVTA